MHRSLSHTAALLTAIVAMTTARVAGAQAPAPLPSPAGTALQPITARGVNPTNCSSPKPINNIWLVLL